jgi:ssDNA-binding Zn-finger/Zn-ribbon topoisomerase 1
VGVLEFAMTVPYLTTALLVGVPLVAVVTPFAVKISCHAPISQRPFRGCRRKVVGLLGRCGTHGRRPGQRLMVLLGGRELAARRICDQCGRRRVFGRRQRDGSPFLGCSGYPACARMRPLADYRG